jgi:hypothetical protein
VRVGVGVGVGACAGMSHQLFQDKPNNVWTVKRDVLKWLESQVGVCRRLWVWVWVWVCGRVCGRVCVLCV